MNRLYTIELVFDIAAGMSSVNTFTLSNPNRKFKLKTVNFNVKLKDIAGDIVPLELNTKVDFYLDITPQNTPFARQFENLLVPANVASNGAKITLYRPQQLKIDSGFISDNLLFMFKAGNLDGAKTFRVFCSIIVEIEDISWI